MMENMRNQKGFTLVEIMMVVIIIGILAVIAIPRYQKYTLESKLSEVHVAVGGIKVGMEKYYNSHGNAYTTITVHEVDANDVYNLSLQKALRIDLGGQKNFFFEVSELWASNLTGYIVTAVLSTYGKDNNYQDVAEASRVLYYFPREINPDFTNEIWVKGWNDESFFQ
ncbi:prepilin-type N-terminal cleavage/methylation domain-containing protein [Thermodesulfobacteriota bacterium]